jgi:DNA polymerase-3 subunit epsilon
MTRNTSVRCDDDRVPLDFTAIDFETANSSSASACSVGLVKVLGGRVVDTAGWLIRPPHGHDEFLEWNVRIHNIRPRDVRDAPSWAQQLGDLVEFAGGFPLVAHNAGFDMGVIRGACAATGMPCPRFDYLCSLKVARTTYSLDSYRLPVVAMAAGYEDFRHHDALEDAAACAAIIVHAARRRGVDSLEGLAESAGVRMGRLGETAAAA